MMAVLKLVFNTFVLIACVSSFFSKDVRSKLFAFIDSVLDNFKEFW